MANESAPRKDTVLDLRAGVDLIDQAPFAMIVLASDGTTVIRWNRGAERLFGWKANEVVGRPLPIVPPDDRERMAQTLAEARITGGARLSATRLRKDGGAVAVRVAYQPLLDAEDTFTGWMAVLEDVTVESHLERQRSERTAVVERLAAVLAYLNTDLDLPSLLSRIAASATEVAGSDGAGVVLFDAGSSQVTAVHGLPQTMIGHVYRPGQGLVADVISSGRPAVADLASTPVSVGVPFASVQGMRTAVVLPLKDREGVIGTMHVLFRTADPTVAHDVMDQLTMFATAAAVAVTNARAYAAQVAAREHERELQEAKALFLAMSSHDIKTPLAVIRGFAETLSTRWDVLTPQVRRDAIEAIERRSASVVARLEDLLAGFRGHESVAVEAVERHPFDVAAILTSAVAEWAGVSADHPVRLVVEAERTVALGDPMVFDRAVGQLLENAIKYSPEGGAITVSVTSAAPLDGRTGRVVVAVADRGVGIGAEEATKVFDRYFRGAAAAAAEGSAKGVGLGLYIVRNQVEAMGGTVVAEPRDGGGAKFTISLPMALD